MHETAEELIVHPDARRVGSDRVVDARLAEERKAKEKLLVGPYAAMRDRARDIIRKAMPSSSDADQRTGGPTKVQLYREAKKRDIKVRSRMT